MFRKNDLDQNLPFLKFQILNVCQVSIVSRRLRKCVREEQREIPAYFKILLSLCWREIDLQIQQYNCPYRVVATTYNGEIEQIPPEINDLVTSSALKLLDKCDNVMNTKKKYEYAYNY